MAQNINTGNLYQAAERAKLNPAQKNQINSFADMYSKHTSLTNLPDAIAALEYDQLSADQQKSMAEFFGDDETKPGQGAVMKAASWLVKPIVEPVKEVLKAANWASDQVTRAYRVGRIAIGENTDIVSAFRRSGANGEQVYNESRISKAIATYGKDRVYVAQQISAGIPLDKIIANAQNPEQKRIAAEASKSDGDSLLDEAVAKVNAAKYSFGRDMANLFLPEDLEGKSGLYTWMSGFYDASFRIVLDPTIILGKAAKIYNAGKFALSKTIGTADKVEKSFQYDNVNRFWTEYTKGLDDLVKARASGEAIEVGEATTRLRRLNPAFGPNGVDDALIKFAKDDMDGVLDVTTAKAFLSNAERIEPLFYGQAGLQIKVMPRLSAFRKARVDLYTKGTRVFSLNDDGTDFLRNIVFDEADARGITTREAALQSLVGRGDELPAAVALRTAERIKAEELIKRNKFSIFSINKRIDNFSRKFNLIPDMDELGNHASPRAHIAFERYARLVYGKYSSRILGDIYLESNIGQRRQMFNGLQLVVGELRGLRGTEGGRRLLETIGTVGRDAVYTNRAFDEANPQGFFPSVVNGSDSALYPYQINERQAFITPQQLDRFAARDGFISSLWGAQYSKTADDVISTFVTGTLAGPRFPVRNAIEDYIFYLANSVNRLTFKIGGGVRSAVQIGRSRRLATDIRTAIEDLNLGLINRYAKAKDKELFVRKFDDIDKGIKRSIDKDGKEVIVKDFYTTKAQKEEAKRKTLAEILLRDKFNDAQIGKFGNDFDRYTYEFAMYGDYENLLRSASEGAYNVNVGSDFVSRAKRISRKHGKVIDFTIDEKSYARQFGSFGEFSPLDQEGKLAWAFQIMTKAQDEFASEGMKLLKIHGNDRGAFVAALAKHIDKPEFKSLKPKFDRYVDTNYTSNQQASAIYDDLRTLFSRSDNSINDNLLSTVVKVSDSGQLKVDATDFSLDFLPSNYTDIPKAIVGPKLMPIGQSENIISDLNTRLWDWLGDANARLSRDQIVVDAAFNIRRELQPYLEDLTKKIGPEAATKQIIDLSEKLAVERVLAFVDNPAVRTQMAWSLRNFARFYRATEDAYRRLYRTVKYNPEAVRKIALTYEGLSHSGFVQRDDQGEPYFIYPGVAPVYAAVNKGLSAFGLGDKFVSPMPLQFGSQIRMLTPSANPESWLPTFSGPLAAISMKTIYGITGFFEDSSVDAISTISKEIGSTERIFLGEIGESQGFFLSILPGHVSRLIRSFDRDERDSQYASAFRKAVTYLEVGGHTPGSDATPGELAQYQKRLRSTITGILGVRYIAGFITPASPTISLKSDMADWVRDNERVNFKQVYSKLIEEYTAKGDPDPVGQAMTDWVKLFPDEVPYVINESEPEFQARFKTSNAAANWVDENKDLVSKYPEGAGFLIPQSGTFSWDAYQFLKDNGFRKTKIVEEFLKETFVAKDKYFYYTQRDKYETALENAGSDSERKRINNAWKIWSGDFKSVRPLLQEEFANSASNNIKRQASYEDLKRLLNESGINNEATRALNKMVKIYEEYLFTKDNVYNSRSERDIRSREFVRESTLEQLKDIARTNPNAKGAFEVLFSSFLRED
jgi:hypothetical protein